MGLALIVLVIALAALISILLSLPVMILWNWLMPAIFGLGEITIFQAWGLNFLTNLLFGANRNCQQVYLSRDNRA